MEQQTVSVTQVFTTAESCYSRIILRISHQHKSFRRRVFLVFVYPPQLFFIVTYWLTCLPTDVGFSVFCRPVGLSFFWKCWRADGELNFLCAPFSCDPCMIDISRRTRVWWSYNTAVMRWGLRMRKGLFGAAINDEFSYEKLRLSCWFYRVSDWQCTVGFISPLRCRQDGTKPRMMISVKLCTALRLRKNCLHSGMKTVARLTVNVKIEQE